MPEGILPHRRPVDWFPEPFDRADMSPELQRSTNSIGTCCDITKYANELERLIKGQPAPTLTDSEVENPAAFALEKHLEDFLVENWANTALGKNYNIYCDNGKLVGQQYQTEAGFIDILAISKDSKELLVVELKRGRASDDVVGQIQRYMGYVKGMLAEPDQIVKGVIIALEDDKHIRWALQVAHGIDFYRYQINFSLIPSESPQLL